MANRRYIDFPIASTSGDTDIILIWQDGANKQTTKATFLSGLPENLDELNDVAISGLTNGQILRYDSVTGKWENADQGNLDLNDLNDVSIVSPSNGQVLVYNSSTSKWENSSGGYVPYTGAVTTVNLGAQTIQAGQFVKAGGTAAQFLKADGSVDSNVYGTGTVTSVALTMPSAFNVANSPITTAGTLAVTGAGTAGQYIRGDGSLADFPQSSGGGSSVSYYLNGSVSQGTIGGVAYKELNKVPILGAGTDFTINADGYIASFLTDAGDPNLLEIPAGNWNFETYFNASSSGNTPSFYVELYKYDGTTFTLLASNSGTPEFIAFGTIVSPYFSTLAVPTTTLALTDRLAVRYYVLHSGRTITMHTENNTLGQVITTFTTGLTSLNGLTAQVQNLAVGTSGTDFNIASAIATHTFNLPTASATNRGALSSADWTIFNNKQNALTNPVTGTGTTNYLPKFTGSTTIGNSQIFDNGTNVGIGTANPGQLLTLSSANTLGTAINIINTSSGGYSYNIFSGGSDATLGPVGSLIFRDSINGVSRIVINSNGNVLIGSTTDNGARLQVSGSGGIRINATTGSAAPGAIALSIRDSGNPVFGFDFNLEGVATGDLYLMRTNSGVQSTVLQVSRATGAATFSSNQNATSTYTFQNTDSTNTNSRLRLDFIGGNSALSIVSIHNDHNYIASVAGKDLYFQQSFGGTTNMVIKSSGNVGIGTASPVSIGGYTALTLNNATTGGILTFQRNGTNIGSIYNTTSDITLGVNSGNATFETSGAERMRITSGGNVLIGTTTDNGAKLNVNGTVFIGNLASGSNAILDFATNASGGPRSIIYRAATAFLDFTNTAGSAVFQLSNGGAATFSSTVTATGYITSSDAKLKKVISKDGDLAIYSLLDSENIHYGYIAQDMQKDYPNQVHTDNKGFLSLNYVEILVKKVNDLEKKIKQLEQ